jgi:hypothetical protein
MTDETLRHLVEQRYSSRFGAVVGDSGFDDAGIASSPSVVEIQKSNHTASPQTGGEQSPGPKTSRNRPLPNEMRKRVSGEPTD